MGKSRLLALAGRDGDRNGFSKSCDYDGARQWRDKLSRSHESDQWPPCLCVASSRSPHTTSRQYNCNALIGRPMATPLALPLAVARQWYPLGTGRIGGRTAMQVVSAKRRDDGEQPEEQLGSKGDSDSSSPAFLCALALLGVGSLAAAAALTGRHHRQDAIRLASLSVSCTTKFDERGICQAGGNCIKNHLSSCEDDEAGERGDLSHELKRDFEQWKTIPYSLTVPLRIVALRSSVPSIWLKDFTAAQGRRLKLNAEFRSSLNVIFTELMSALTSGQLNHRSTVAADVVTVGDSWLAAAINRGTVVPLGEPHQLDWFQRLHPRWQALLQRSENGELSCEGRVWAAPYRCGCFLIAYRKDKLAKAGIHGIKDWEDLWNPQLAGRISTVNSSREVVGMVLKSMGASYNTENLDNLSGGKESVRERFHGLRKQVRVFDDVNYLKALGAGDVWVAVGWSCDVMPFVKRSSNIAVVAPASGTSLWADLWAVPAATKVQSDRVGGRVRGPSPMVPQWLEFCLQPARSLSLRQGDFGGASPLELDYDADDHRTDGPKLETNLTASGMPPRDILDKCEFLEPLNEGTVAQYRWLLESPVENFAPKK